MSRIVPLVGGATVALLSLALASCSGKSAQDQGDMSRDPSATSPGPPSRPYTQAQASAHIGHDTPPANHLPGHRAVPLETFSTPALELDRPAIDLGAPLANHLADPAQPLSPASNDDPAAAPPLLAWTLPETTNTLPSPASPADADLPTLLDALERALTDNPSNHHRESLLRDGLLLSALHLLDSRDTFDAGLIDHLDSPQREVLRAYQDHFRRLGEEAAASAEPAAILRLIDDLRAAIAPPTPPTPAPPPPPLAIPAAQLCTRIDGFGRYAAFDRNSFLAGRAQPVVIYTEVDQFTSALTAEGLWKTDLSQSLDIRALDAHEDAPPLWRQDWQPAPDLSTRKRTDFFISHIITLPATLPPGDYTLTIRIRDDATGEIAESAIPFSIVTDAELAATVPD